MINRLQSLLSSSRPAVKPQDKIIVEHTDQSMASDSIKKQMDDFVSKGYERKYLVVGDDGNVLYDQDAAEEDALLDAMHENKHE